MKRYGDLFDKMTGIENISAAHAAARLGKRHYAEVQKVDAEPERHFDSIRTMLRSGRYRTSKYRQIQRRCSGKVRIIHKLPYFPDRIVHHCIVQVVDKIWRKTLIRDTYACIPKRGIHDGARRVRQALLDRDATRFCLKMDVRQFYPSLDHDILKAIVRSRIKDRMLLCVIDEIIDSTPGGVPIGNYLSQHFGNLYLSGYDHWMKELHGCKAYFRYCDDVVVLGPSKSWLHDLRKATDRYWAERLHLQMKANWQVFPVDARGIDFLGYRFFNGYTLLRKSIATRYKRRMGSIRSGRVSSPKLIVGRAASYGGWLIHANCHNLLLSQRDERIETAVAQAKRRLKEAA